MPLQFGDTSLDVSRTLPGSYLGKIVIYIPCPIMFIPDFKKIGIGYHLDKSVINETNRVGECVDDKLICLQR